MKAGMDCVPLPGCNSGSSGSVHRADARLTVRNLRLLKSRKTGLALSKLELALRRLDDVLSQCRVLSEIHRHNAKNHLPELFLTLRANFIPRCERENSAELP